VASVSNTVSGWIQASTCDTLESGWRVEIIGLVVSATCRRTGIGRALVAAVEEWAKGTAATTIIVRSNVQRSDSHSFYPAIGYEKSKTQHLYKKTLARNAQQDARVDTLTRAPQR
jgi:GNAT superfamily N-acetyltransferase